MLHSLGSDWCIAFHPLLGQLGLSRLASIGHWNEWFSFPYERNGDEPGKGSKEMELLQWLCLFSSSLIRSSLGTSFLGFRELVEMPGRKKERET